MGRYSETPTFVNKVPFCNISQIISPVALCQCQRDHQSLQKCYFLFLNSLASNNVTEVIAKGNFLVYMGTNLKQLILKPSDGFKVGQTALKQARWLQKGPNSFPTLRN